MGRRRAIIGLAVGLPLGVVLLLALAAGWWLQAEAGRRWLTELWREKAASHLGAELRIGSLEGNPLWELRVKDLSLTRQGRTLLTVEEVELSHNPLALLGGRLQLGRLELLRPRLEVSPDLFAGWGGGDADLPPLRLTIDGLRVVQGRLRLAGQALEEVEGLELRGWFSLDALGPRGEVESLQAQARLPGLDQPARLSASARLNKERLTVPALVVEAAGARLEAKGELAWHRETSLKATARLALPGEGLPWAWSPRQALEISLGLQGPLTSLAVKAEAASQTAGLSLSGRADLTAPALELAGGIKLGDAQALGLTPFPLTLDGRLRLEARGLPGRPGSDASLRLDLEQARSGETISGRGHLEAAWRQGRAEVTSLELVGDWGRVQGSAGYLPPTGAEPARVEARLEGRDFVPPPALAERLPAWARQIRLQGGLSAQGIPDDLALRLELGPSSLAPGLDITRLEAKGGWRQDRLHLESLAAQVGDATLTAQGRADAQEAALDLTLQAPDLARLAPLLSGLDLGLPTPLQGGLEAKARVQGPWTQPALKLEAQARALSAPGLSCAQASLAWESPRLALPPSGRLLVSAAQLEYQGWRWPRVSLDAALTPDLGRLELHAQGPQMRLSASASAPGAAWPLEVRLEGLHLAWGQEAAWSLAAPAGLRLGPQGLALRGLALTRPGERVTLEGGMDAQGGLDAALVLTGVRPAPWLKSPAPLESLRLDGEARLSGSLAAPQAAGELRLSGLVWTGLPPSELRLSGGLQGGFLRLRGEVASRERRLLSLDGQLGLDASLSPPRLAVRPHSLEASLVGANLPLALLEPITPFLSGLKGRADLEVAMGGSLSQPNLDGRATLRGGGLTIVPTGQVVSDIEMDLRLDGRRLLVDKVAARSGGTLSISGEALLPWSDPGRCDLNLTARAIKIGLGSIGEVITDADLHVGGTALNPLVTGPARPSQARIHPRLASPLAMAEVVVLKRGQRPPPLRRERRKAPRIVLPGPLAPLRMDTVVDAGPGLRVAVDDGWLELAGQTLVRKEPGGPLTFHRGFAIRRGLIMAVGKAFEISPGQTDFAGKDVPDPDLRLEATLRTGTTQIFINLTGSAFESKLNFSSEPPLSQADILSTIIFGRPARALSAGESQQLSAQALALLGQRGKAEMERLLGRTLAPDVVAVHNEAQTGPSLEAGKYLSPDLYLRYRQNMGPEGGQNVGLELKVKPYLSLESQIGTTRDNGADVIFSFDFD